MTGRTATNGTAYATNYAYLAGNATNKTTPLVQTITQGSGSNAMNYTYTYDSRGNITSVTHNGKTTSYKYDAVGQLTRVNDETDTTSGVNGTTWVYYYNNHGGNFSSKRRYPYTPAGTSLPSTYDERIIYTYGDSKWKDKLTKYNGVSITYDGIGNPTNNGTWSYTWQAGRQLAGMSKSGMSVAFSYDHNGLRTQKVVIENNVTTTTNYQLHGKLVTELTRGTDKLHFFYDAQSRPAMVEYNGVMYTYVHNLQGDIVGILDSTGAVVVEYGYDAWGRPTGVTGNMAGTLGALNPFRYRGYVYDEETGLYYLRSRYYNPVWQRFVNGESPIISCRSLITNNSFTYCKNEPIDKDDHDGSEGLVIPLQGGDPYTVLASIAISIIAGAIMELSTRYSKKHGAKDHTREGQRAARELVSARKADAVSKITNSTPNTYYFAFLSTVNGCEKLTILDYPLDAAIARTVLSYERNYSMLQAVFHFKKREFGVYTPLKEDAIILAKSLGSTLVSHDHFPEGETVFGYYYSHFHDCHHWYHIWYGYPSEYNW